MIISVGKKRTSTAWRPVDMTWDELVTKLTTFVRTPETMREYRAMSVEEKGRVKDIGGFVGGRVEGGRRVRGSVKERTLVTLDADYAPQELWDDAVVTMPWRMLCYSTHSHTEEKPRLRFVIPLSHSVTPEQYVAIARKLAECIDIDAMDRTTYEPERLMYWPSCSADAEPYCRVQEGPVLEPEEILARYGLGDAWKDTTLWPIAEGENEVVLRDAKRQGDPREKPGIVGLFCRTYDVYRAIDELLPGVYEPAGEGRFTYTGGSTHGGAVVYEGGDFLYSHHSTDPAGGQLVNAFDLVRLHKFGELDADCKAESVTKLPSYTKMCEFAAGLDEIKAGLVEQQNEMVADLLDGDEDGGESKDWVKKLELNNKTGKPEPTQNNILLILRNDPRLKGVLSFNDLTQRRVMLRTPPWGRRVEEETAWRDADIAGLHWYMEHVWKIDSPRKVDEATEQVSQENHFHPVQDYLHGLVWDGVERLDTMLVRWMAAEDNEYVRAVTRKWMCGAVKRALHPGCKFEGVLILVGPQGIGKSRLPMLLSKGWFTDSLRKMDGSKESFEGLFGAWIVELAELAAAQRTEVEQIKAFTAAQVDRFRKAYGRITEDVPRQCVFYGSTNAVDFLHDESGNRRFWPVQVAGIDHGVLTGFEDEVDQLWAEAVVRMRQGEQLFLTGEVEAEAKRVQEQHMEDDEALGLYREFVDQMLPGNWYEMSVGDRQSFFQNRQWELYKPEQLTLRRDHISVAEIKVEFHGMRLEDAGRDQKWSRQIGKSLTRMGWQNSGPMRIPGYGTPRSWVRPG